jgi:hypothetical protein
MTSAADRGPEEVLRAFLLRMGQWEKKNARSGSPDKAGLALIFAVYCTPRRKDAAVTSSLTRPPDHVPEDEVVGVEVKGEKAKIRTRRPWCAVESWVTTLAKVQGAWRIDAIEWENEDGSTEPWFV